MVRGKLYCRIKYFSYSKMSAPSVSTAFIDLMTYGELEKQMYTKQRISQGQNIRGNIIMMIMIIIVLKYILKNK